MIQKEFYNFTSKDGQSIIHCVKWVPETGPKAVLQVVHGMLEYIERYDEFATFLAEKGFVVVGHDHIGHGHSVANDDELGIMAGAHPALIMVEDVYTHYSLTRKAYPNIPYFILGHSMGSYVTRAFLALKTVYLDDLSGAVIMGTGQESAMTYKGGIALVNLMSLFKGKNYRSTFVRDMTYSAPYKQYDCYGKDYANSWLSKNIKDVEKYYHDKYCTFLFSLNAYKGLVEALKYACSKEYAVNMRRSLPLFFVSGDADPVGNLGVGTKAAADMYTEVGLKDVSIKLYTGDRHEILHEIDREQVFVDIYNWLDSHC